MQITVHSQLFGQLSWSFDQLMRIGDVIKVLSCALTPPVSCRPVENRVVWKKPKRHFIQWYHPESPRKKKEKNSLPTARSWSLSSGIVGEWFLGMRGREDRQSTPTHTSGCWQKSRSVSNQFGLTRIQHTSCVSQCRREAGMKLEKITEAQICCIFFTSVRFAFAGRRGGEKKFLSPGTDPFLGGSGFSVIQGSTQVWSIGKQSRNSVEECYPFHPTAMI